MIHDKFTNFSKTYFKSTQIRQRKFESVTSAKKLNAEYRLFTKWHHFITTARMICQEIGSVSSSGAFFFANKDKCEMRVTGDERQTHLGVWERGRRANFLHYDVGCAQGHVTQGGGQSANERMRSSKNGTCDKEWRLLVQRRMRLIMKTLF